MSQAEQRAFSDEPDADEMDDCLDGADDPNWCLGCGNPIDICQCIPDDPDQPTGDERDEFE